MNSNQVIKNILVDIEGTTSSISFVHEVLFPYAKKKLPSFIKENFDKAEVNSLLLETLKSIKVKANNEDQIIDIASKQLLQWIEEDKKVGVLKELQGLIWEHGYKSGEYHGHIYKDAYDNLVKWHNDGLELYVYSSGSVKAQKLLFAHTEYGDLNKLFKDNFDTKIGAKTETSSYKEILKKINTEAKAVLFLSDNEDELVAANQLGIQLIKLARPEDQIKPSQEFRSVQNFDEIDI